MNELNNKKALFYSEKYGVIEYIVKNSTMIYYANYPLEHNTYKCTVKLNILHETRKALKRYYKKGNYNLCN